MESIDGAKGSTSAGTRLAQAAVSGVAVGGAIALLVGVPYINQLAGNPMLSNVVRFGPVGLLFAGGVIWGLKKANSAVKSQQRELSRQQLSNLRRTQLTAGGLVVLPVTTPKITSGSLSTKEAELSELPPSANDDGDKKVEFKSLTTSQQTLSFDQRREILSAPQNLAKQILNEGCEDEQGNIQIEGWPDDALDFGDSLKETATSWLPGHRKNSRRKLLENRAYELPWVVDFEQPLDPDGPLGSFI